MTDARTLPRRVFLRAAVATGGAAALGACLDRETADVPRGPDDPSVHPRRQHAWNEVLSRDDHGNVLGPRHRVLLSLDYRRDGRPVEGDRQTVEAALRGVERAYRRGSDGLLLTVSYSPAYFERFDAGVPAGVDLPEPRPLSPFEEPDLDTPDAVVHLASDHARVVLGAEEALRGNRETLNGVDQPGAALTDAFAVADRRTGFVGDGLPAENSDVDGIPEGAVADDAPLFMGFKSDFRENQASEDRVTVDAGPFAGGTTQHVSTLRLDLRQWYEQDDRFQREAKMFCPHHAENGTVEGAGENLGTDTGMDDCRPAEEAAREVGVVGHSQKTAAVREDDEPLILRRDFNSTNADRAGVHFVSLQRRIAQFVETREAMNGTDLAEESAVGQRNNNGILQYVRTLRRGNFLVPPRPLRALPPADPDTSESGETSHAPA